MTRKNTAKDFLERVDEGSPDECWEWQGRTNDKRHWQCYGRFDFEGRAYLAHRFMWTITNGSVPKGMLVCHHCDNPKCCNPGHMFLGTHSDNTRDRIKKHGYWQSKGEDRPNTKLANADVIEMRRMHNDGASIRELSTRFSSHYDTVWKIIRRRSWKHI